MDEKIRKLLAQVTDTPQVLTQPDLPLWEEGVLDSFGLLEFLALLEEELGILLYPTQLRHDQLATPASLVEAVLQAAREQGIET